jgi:uncharacterized damage-inducible protein DinB
MPSRTLLVSQFQYKAWTNGNTLEALEELDETTHATERTAALPSRT